MTIPKLSHSSLNMISAWIGALATLTVLIAHPPTSLHHAGIPTALAAIAITIILTIVRFKPHRGTLLALSGGLGAAFSALSYCLIQ